MENRNDERKIICIRHARSEFNSQIDQVMRSLDGLDETETLQAIAKVKFGLEFIDCSLSEEGQRQVIYPSLPNLVIFRRKKRQLNSKLEKSV